MSTPNKSDTEPKTKNTRATKTAPTPRPDFFANLKARSGNMQKIAAGQSVETVEEKTSDAGVETIEMLSLSAIEPNPDQPRQTATPEQDEELAADIRERGILQPVIVRPLGGAGGRYELVAGERRCRAARLAGLDQIPAIVRPYDDREARTVAAIENLQRQNLEPLDEARYFRFLADEYNLSNRQIADGLHKSASYVDQRMRLLQNDRVKNTQLLHASQDEEPPVARPWKYKPREWQKLKITLAEARGGLHQVSAKQKRELQKTISDLKSELEALEKELNP